MKVHLTIKSYAFVDDSEAVSLCGVNPRHGTYDIRTSSTFFHAPESDQCARCVSLFQMRGNNIEKLRADAKLMPKPGSDTILADRQVCHA